jgi:hypothetical protein
MRTFRRHAWVVRNIGIGMVVLGALLQWHDQSDGPALMLLGFVSALGAGIRSKIDQDLKVGAMNGYEEALDQLGAYQGERAEQLRSNGWEEIMIEQHRRQWYVTASEHYRMLADLRFIPLRPSWPDLTGASLDDWRFVGEQVLRQEVPVHER